MYEYDTDKTPPASPWPWIKLHIRNLRSQPEVSDPQVGASRSLQSPDLTWRGHFFFFFELIITVCIFIAFFTFFKLFYFPNPLFHVIDFICNVFFMACIYLYLTALICNYSPIFTHIFIFFYWFYCFYSPFVPLLVLILFSPYCSFLILVAIHSLIIIRQAFSSL